MIRYENCRLNCEKLIPTKLSSILSEKYIILILYFQLFPNITRKENGAFVGSFWAAYPKKDPNLRKSVTAAERFMFTMRFLTSGDSQVSLSFLFRMGKKSMSHIMSETREAIVRVLF